MTEQITTLENTPITPVIPDIPADEKSMGDIYDRVMSGGVDDDPPEQQAEAAPASDRDDRGRFRAKATESAESMPQKPGEAVENPPGVSDRAPSSLPANLPPDMADAWAAIPEAHRDRFGKVFTELHTKMSDLGRQSAAYRDIKPVIDDMNATYGDYLTRNNMRPADAINFLYTVQRDMDSDPVNTLLTIGNRYGVIDQLAQRLGIQGQPNGEAVETAQLKSIIQGLESKISSLMSPESFNTRITHAMTEREVEQAVERFTQEKPFYADVEPHLAQFVAIAREMDPNADRLEWLSRAYDMAVNAIPAVREKAQAAAAKAAAPKPDQRAAAARQAASINVTSTASGKHRPRSEEDAMGDVWDRLHRAS